MSRFTKGMKAGAKPFMQIGKECAWKMDSCLEKISGEVNELYSDFDTIVDIVAEDDSLNRKAIIENFKHKRNIPKSMNYTIRIIYSPEYFNIADDTRHVLNTMENFTSMQAYNDYRFNNRKADYYVFFLNGKLQKDCNTREIFRANGCRIIEKGNLLYCYMSPLTLIDDSQWRNFRKTYQEIANRTFDRNDATIAKAVKSQKRMNRRNECGVRIINRVTELSDSIDLFLDEHEHDNIFTEIITIPARICWFFSSVVGVVSSFPVAFFATLFGDLMNRIDAKDPAAIREVQAQLIQLKVAEYIKNKQHTQQAQLTQLV